MSFDTWNREGRIPEFVVALYFCHGSWRRHSIHYELNQLVREDLLTVNKIHCPWNHLNAMADCKVNLLLHGLDLLEQACLHALFFFIRLRLMLVGVSSR
jgi:hypothetical protein